ncbi:MAG: MBL fold metallo-hydrolase [Treponema sp.]|nr:MBL fold metallo-hydrolase [Treponema sp.]
MKINHKKSLLLLITIVLLTVSCTKRMDMKNDHSGEETIDFYTKNEIHPRFYSIADTKNNVFCYLLIGDEKALLFDTTYGSAPLHRIIREITELPVTVVLGHGHMDHSGGAAQLYAYLNSDVWMHETELNLFRYYNMETRFLKELKIGQVFNLGGLDAEIVGMEGHTAGSIGIFVKEHRLLLTSDSANPDIWLFLNESLPINEYIAMLERTILLDFDTFFIGHSDEPMSKSDFQEFIKAARNVSVEKSEPYEPYHSVFIYREDGASVFFKGDSAEWERRLSATESNLPPGNLGAFEIVLWDNFLYGNGYQAYVQNRNMLNGYRLKKGDTYTLKVTYTASRDLEKELLAGFVDVTGGKWKTLSYTQKAIEPPNVILGHASKAGEVVSSEVTISIVTAAGISTAAANTLVLETLGQGRHKSRNSGVQGPVTISFTEFVLTKR